MQTQALVLHENNSGFQLGKPKRMRVGRMYIGGQIRVYVRLVFPSPYVIERAVFNGHDPQEHPNVHVAPVLQGKNVRMCIGE